MAGKLVSGKLIASQKVFYVRFFSSEPRIVLIVPRVILRSTYVYWKKFRYQQFMLLTKICSRKYGSQFQIALEAESEVTGELSSQQYEQFVEFFCKINSVWI